MPTPPNPVPDLYSIVVNIIGDEKKVSYLYKTKITDSNNAAELSKNHTELTTEQKAVYDSFVAMVESL